MKPGCSVLHPPLKLLWALEASFAAVTVSESGVTFAPLTRRREGLAAVAPDGQVLWTRRAKGPCVAQPLPGGRRLAVADSPKYETLSVLDASTGTVEWTGKYMELLPVDPAMGQGVAIDWAISGGAARVLGISLPPEPEVRWVRSFCVAGRPRKHVAVNPGPMTSRSLFLLDCSQPDRAALLSVDPRTGDDQWRREGSNLRAMPRIDGTWQAALATGDRLVYRTEVGAACVDAHTGRDLWSVTTPRFCSVYGDVVVATEERAVWLLSSETGHTLRKRDLARVLTACHPSNRLTGGAAVSDTHVFVCDELGTLWALDVESLEPAWSHCPAGTVGGLNSPKILGGRLYANTVSWERGVSNHLYCWGPANEGESPGPSDTEASNGEGNLLFAIVETLSRRQVTKRAPFHETGGPFTVYRCRLEEGGAEFFFADRVVRGGGLLQGVAAALWVTGVREGEALLRAFQAAMPLQRRRVKGTGKGVRVKAPTILRGVDLHGPGVRRRRKWNSPDNEAELIVEWDTKAKRGMIRETDTQFREAVLGLIAGLLRRE